jgi:hypothetical protein
VLGYSKKDLLLFEQLFVMGLNRQLGEAKSDSAFAADCAFLENSGFLVSAPESPSEVLVLSPPLVPMGAAEVPRKIIEAFRTCSLYPSLYNDEPMPEGSEVIVAYLLRALGRSVTTVTESSRPAPAWDIVKSLLDSAFGAEEPDVQRGVIELVTEALPVPGENVPLGDILDFVSDPETQRKRDRLDIWTRRAAQSGRELQDLGLEMEEMLHELADHMRLADMRSQTSGLRIALSLPLGIIEELVHLRPKGALNVVFEYKDRKASRLEAELAAPGGALAYIYEARRLFGDA